MSNNNSSYIYTDKIIIQQIQKNKNKMERTSSWSMKRKLIQYSMVSNPKRQSIWWYLTQKAADCSVRSLYYYYYYHYLCLISACILVPDCEKRSRKTGSNKIPRKQKWASRKLSTSYLSFSYHSAVHDGDRNACHFGPFLYYLFTSPMLFLLLTFSLFSLLLSPFQSTPVHPCPPGKLFPCLLHGVGSFFYV